MTIKTAEYFPLQFKYVAAFLVIASLPLIIEGGLRLVGVALLVISVTILTIHYEFEIDKDSGKYREYVRLLWMKLGKPVSYSNVEYCYITASKYSQKMQLKAANTTLSGMEINAYLKFSDSEKIHIARGRNKDKLISKISKITDYLDIEIVDHTIED